MRWYRPIVQVICLYFNVLNYKTICKYWNKYFVGDIIVWHILTDRWTGGHVDWRTNEQEDKWTGRQVTWGQVDRRSNDPLDSYPAFFWGTGGLPNKQGFNDTNVDITDEACRTIWPICHTCTIHALCTPFHAIQKLNFCHISPIIGTVYNWRQLTVKL